MKGKGYSYENAVVLFNETVSSDNESKDLKELRKTALLLYLHTRYHWHDSLCVSEENERCHRKGTREF